VATALAQRGEMNGFLTAVQDVGLPGYAAGVPTAAGISGVSSLVSALDQMTSVPDSVESAFRSQWSDAASIDPLLLVRRVQTTPLPWRTIASPVAAAASLPPIPATVCPAEDQAEAAARARLLALAIDAKARGIAMRRARYPASEERIEALRLAIVHELRARMTDQGVVPLTPASFVSSAPSCFAISR
jgi:hypothetical protein